MDKLNQAIAAYEKAGEELRNRAYIEAIDGTICLTLEESREMRDRILRAEIDGAATERAILGITAVSMLKRRNIENPKS